MIIGAGTGNPLAPPKKKKKTIIGNRHGNEMTFKQLRAFVR